MIGCGRCCASRAPLRKANYPDRKAAKRAGDAIMTMKTIDIAKIELAQAGLTNTRAVLYI
jgi:hypothetical protein